MRVVFLGTADFGIPAFDMLRQQGHDICAVVTAPAKPQGRGRKLTPSPLACHAERLGVGPVLTPSDLHGSDLAAQLTPLKADIFVVVAFRLLPPSIFGIPPLGTLNIHASLLPKYRGPAPIQRAIEHGETRSGITVFRIDAGVDSGRILVQRPVDIGLEETTPQLYGRLSVLGAEALVEAIGLAGSQPAAGWVQDAAEATRAPKLLKAEGAIDWSQSAQCIFNKIRAFKPFPGTSTVLAGARLCVEWARPTDQHGPEKPGTVVATEHDSFVVQCGRGRLQVFEVKPEGRTRMDAGAFMRGSSLTVGTILS